MEILSSCFLRLVQDDLDLPVCRAFVATATILPGVKPLEPNVPPKSRCRTSTDVPIQEIDRLYGHPRSRLTSLLTLCLHYSQVCRVKDWKYRNRWNGSSGRLAGVLFQRRATTPEGFSWEVSPLMKFFLRRIDAWRLVTCHPCECQAGGVLRYRRVIASFLSVYRWGKDVHCIVGVLGSLTTRYDSVITRYGEGWPLSC